MVIKNSYKTMKKEKIYIKLNKTSINGNVVASKWLIIYNMIEN
jgi:hypothetical protein